MSILKLSFSDSEQALDLFFFFIFLNEQIWFRSVQTCIKSESSLQLFWPELNSIRQQLKLTKNQFYSQLRVSEHTTKIMNWKFAGENYFQVEILTLKDFFLSKNLNLLSSKKYVLSKPTRVDKNACHTISYYEKNACHTIS